MEKKKDKHVFTVKVNSSAYINYNINGVNNRVYLTMNTYKTIEIREKINSTADMFMDFNNTHNAYIS